MSDSAEARPDTDADAARAKRFAQAVNRQGYAFQNAVLQKLHELVDTGASRWRMEVAEFPTEVAGLGTRIDFVLSAHRTDIWLLAECKRVNPAYGEWFFVPTSYLAHEWTGRFIAEVVTVADRPDIRGIHPLLSGGVVIRPYSQASYFHRGFQVKTGKQGDPSGGTGDAIEEAASQVTKGLNGMVEFLDRNLYHLGPNRRRILIPVIFTTARLYTTTTDMASAKVGTGEMDPAALNPEPVPFLFYQYPLSPGIKHSKQSRVAATAESARLPLAMASEFLRTVVVVNAAGIEKFTKGFWPDNMDYSELE
jgi:hypothetical protein